MYDFGRPKLDITSDSLQTMTVKECKYNGTFEDLVRKNVTSDACFVFKLNNMRVLSYVSDIRFDYENGVIYCPCYTFDYFKLPEDDYKKYRKTKEGHSSSLLRYNCKFIKVLLWTITDGWLVDSISIFSKPILNIGIFEGIKRYSTKNLKVFNSTTVDDCSVLFNKYIRQCVKYTDLYFSDKEQKYISCKYSMLQGSHKKYLKKYNLKWYADEYVKKTKASPTRVYNILDVSKYSSEELGLLDFSTYSERRLDFECYLLAHIVNKDYWRGIRVDKLVSGEWFFLKIKRKGVSLILKADWFRGYL